MTPRTTGQRNSNLCNDYILRGPVLRKVLATEASLELPLGTEVCHVGGTFAAKAAAPRRAVCVQQERSRRGVDRERSSSPCLLVLMMMILTIP